jgi:hypothetical protein
MPAHATICVGCRSARKTGQQREPYRDGRSREAVRRNQARRKVRAA